MRTKTMAVYFMLFIMCTTLVWLTGCHETRIDLAKKTQISDGEFFAQINDLKLWYKVSGTGPVCILPTPGWGPSSELYYIKLAPLEEMFTMVYLDTRGSGRSQRPELNEYTMSHFVSDIEGLRNHLGVKTMWLMGHSDGGPMILNYAFKYENHVQGLIMVDAPIGDSSKGNDRMKRMQLRKDELWFDTAFKGFTQMATTQEEFEAHNQTIMPFFFSSIENLEKNHEVFEKISLSFHASQGRGPSEQLSTDLAAFMSVMEIPTLIIVGVDDFICPPSVAQYLHQEIPNSKLLVIEHTGHFPWMEEPDQFFGGMSTFLPKLGYHKN
ncbi:alpha/beta fold hydrolase [bacterium]